jgi:hypothetical protein
MPAVILIRTLFEKNNYSIFINFAKLSSKYFLKYLEKYCIKNNIVET